MDYIKYKKSVVMLTEQNRDFALDKGKPIKGYVKIETGENKGAARVGVENLRYYEKGSYVYKLILFGKRKEKTLYKVLGDVHTGRQGGGETYLNFHPANVDGQGNGLEFYNVAVLVAISTEDQKEPLHPVLRGTIDAEKKTPLKEAPRNYNSYYNEYLLGSCRTMEKKKDSYDRIVPFREDKTKAEWKRVGNTARFPMVSSDTQYVLSRYRHFIFGIGKNHYFIGIPGRYFEKEQPEGGKSGFTLWQPIIGAEKLMATAPNAPYKNRQAAYGYWIAAINKETGAIEEI